MEAGRSRTLSAVMGSALTPGIICGLLVWVALQRGGKDRPGGQEERGVQLRDRGVGSWVAAQYDHGSSSKIVT